MLSETDPSSLLQASYFMFMIVEANWGNFQVKTSVNFNLFNAMVFFAK